MNQLSFQKNAVLTAIAEIAPNRSKLIRTFPKVGFVLDLSPREVHIIPGHVVRLGAWPSRALR